MKKLTNEKRAVISTFVCLLLILIGILLQYFKNPLSSYSFLLAIVLGGFKQTKEGLLDTFENKHLNVDLLMALAALGACIIGNWLEGAMLIFIFSLSGALEEYTTSKSKKEIANLIHLQPETALKLTENEQIIEVDVENLIIGDQLIVPKGSSIPIDGELIGPNTSIDEAAISGESIPVDKSVGAELFGGTLNIGQAFTMKVTKESQDTLFAKIIRLVDEAQNTPSQTATFIEKIENIYVKAVLVIIPLTIFIPYFFLNWSWHESFYRGMVLLVVASPCALVASATPATLAAISNGARNGVLFKGGIYLENLAEIKAISFDKTGTLTRGVPSVTDAIFITNQQAGINALLTMEKQSTHPLAQALVTYFQNDGTKNYPDVIVQDITGVGMQTTIQNDLWQIGKVNFQEENQIESQFHADIQTLQSAGKTVICLFKNQTLVAYFGLLDVPKPEAKEVIHYFQQAGIHTTMITGDHEKTASAIGKQIAVDEIYASCLPEDKTTLIQKQKENIGMNMMVGDGINDAPALANAAIGVAMGEGSDIAMDVADVVLMKNDLTKLQMSHQLSKKLKQVVTQNIIFSGVVILLLILSNFLQIINLPLGVVGHEGSTILVILNGLRLLKTIPIKQETDKRNTSVKKELLNTNA